MNKFFLSLNNKDLQGKGHFHSEKLVRMACHKTVIMNMETILKVRSPKAKLHSKANAIYKICLWISQILTMSCYWLPVMFASSASSQVANLQSIAHLILLCIWDLLTYRLMPIWTLKEFACLSSAPRQTVRPFTSSSLVVVPPLYVLWFPWEITFTFMDWNLDLYFLTRMILLFLDPSSLHS